MLETTLNGQTLKIVSENVQKLKALFPEIVSEDKIDFEKLQAVLGEYIENDNERYNFTWNGKGRALRLSQTPSTGTLRPCKEESKDWDNTQNLYIEGDNLEVLKLLQKTYHNKIKMIYIDPPYNTGKDFVYPDDYKDNLENYMKITGQKDEDGGRLSSNAETSGRYHTNWLNMMYPRLRLARNLLKDDGVIFVSIDNKEVDNLKKLCNEIFGEENFITCIANINNPKGRSDDKYVATSHEYLMVYKKADTIMYGFDLEEKVIKRYNKFDDNGKRYREIDLRKTGDSDRREDRPNMFYYFLYNTKTRHFYISNEDIRPEGYIQIYPTREDGSMGRWRWGIDTSNENISQLIPKFMKVKEKWTVMEKDYLSDDESVKPTTNWNFKDVNSERGTEEFLKLGFKKEIFEKPKPVGTIQRTLKISTKKNDIVLDFFAGSSITAHAVIQLNSEDGGNRKYIMVQLPEPCGEETEAAKAGYKNICEIGKERIRRAGDKIKAELVDKQSTQQTILDDEHSIDPESLDIGFKVFKLDSSNLKKWNPDYDNLEDSLKGMVSNYVEGRTELDVVYEVMLKYGIDLTFPVEEYNFSGKTVYSIGLGVLVICLDNYITAALAQDIVKLKKKLSPESMRVVFKDNGFINDAAKTNVKENLRQAGIDEFVTV